MIVKNIDAQVESIITEFDFKKVHKVMKYMNWTWYGQGVPTVPELKSRAERMLRDIARWPGLDFIRDGGFKAYKFKDGHVRLGLAFVLEEYESY